MTDAIDAESHYWCCVQGILTHLVFSADHVDSIKCIQAVELTINDTLVSLVIEARLGCSLDDIVCHTSLIASVEVDKKRIVVDGFDAVDIWVLQCSVDKIRVSFFTMIRDGKTLTSIGNAALAMSIHTVVTFRVVDTWWAFDTEDTFETCCCVS